MKEPGKASQHLMDLFGYEWFMQHSSECLQLASELPHDTFVESELERLRNVIPSKSELIQKALRRIEKPDVDAKGYAAILQIVMKAAGYLADGDGGKSSTDRLAELQEALTGPIVRNVKA